MSSRVVEEADMDRPVVRRKKVAARNEGTTRTVIDTGEYDASAERLAEVVTETEARCPVFNLVKDAGVNLDVVWVRRVPGA